MSSMRRHTCNGTITIIIVMEYYNLIIAIVKLTLRSSKNEREITFFFSGTTLGMVQNILCKEWTAYEKAQK